MLTACPECRTTFRITKAHLDAKRGLVRCGHCNAVFNAYDALLPEIEAPPEKLEPAEPTQAKAPLAIGEPKPNRVEPRIELRFDAPEPPPSPVATPAPTSAPSRAPLYRMETSADELADLSAYHTEPAEEASIPAWLQQAVRDEGSSEAILLSELPVRDEASAVARFGRGLLIALLLALLSAQLVYFARSPLAAWQPALRPYLEAACAPLHCTVPLPRDRDALRVESSSLETDPESPANARLRVAFSNRAGHELAWPHVMLTLTDVSDKVLAQRVFAPRDYLKAGDMKKTGIPPRQEYEVLLDLNMANLAAAGYRVALEYP